MKTKRKNRDKKLCEIIHAKRRFLERYGVEVNDADLTDMVTQIRTGSARFLWKDTNTRTLFRVKVRGNVADVVYDNLRGVIVTALPLMNLDQTTELL
jgi:hypothetical protein